MGFEPRERTVAKNLYVYVTIKGFSFTYRFLLIGVLYQAKKKENRIVEKKEMTGNALLKIAPFIITYHYHMKLQ